MLIPQELQLSPYQSKKSAEPLKAKEGLEIFILILLWL